jgi:HemY protein
LESSRIKQHRAAVFLATAQSDIRQGHYDKALQAAEQAMRHAHDWLPAVIILAQTQMLSGHRRAALRTVERNWPHMPHPQLAAILRGAGTDPVEVCEQIEKLCRENKDSAVGHLIIAETAFAADIWGEVRRHLMAIISQGGVTQSVYRLMARLERRESGDERAALQWLTKAADAVPDPAWLCSACGGTHKEWQALCAHCGEFNALDWRSPGISRKRETSANNQETTFGANTNFRLIQEY